MEKLRALLHDMVDWLKFPTDNHWKAFHDKVNEAVDALEGKEPEAPAEETPTSTDAPSGDTSSEPAAESAPPTQGEDAPGA